MKITKREIIASITIVALMLILGVFISNKISEAQMDSNEKYYKALKIRDEELFKYGMETNVGNAFVEGELIALDSVSYEEVDGEYLYIKKVREEYTRHTRTVTYTDSKGKTQTKTEVYYSWDYAGSEDKQSENVLFLNQQFKTTQFVIPSPEHIKTINISSDVRYKYYGYPQKSNITIFTRLANNNIEEKGVVINKDKNIVQMIEELESSIAVVIFWIVWIVLISVVVYKFYYLENRWLE